MWTEEELNYIRKLTEGSTSNHWTRWAKEMSEVFGELRDTYRTLSYTREGYRWGDTSTDGDS